MRVLVTGSTGFLGSTFGCFAARSGHCVLGLGRSAKAAKDWPGSYQQIDSSVTVLTRAIDEFKPDLIFHGAGTASVANSFDDPMKDFSGSVGLFTTVIEALRLSASEAFLIFPSSAAVYGNPKILPVGEDAVIQPISPYGFHKAVCELIAREYAECFRRRIIVCRLFSVFGAAQRRLLLWDLFKQLSGPGGVVTLAGTGSESRDFLHVDEVIEVMLGLADAIKRQRGQTGCRIVNVASGVETTIANVAHQMRALIAPGKEITFLGALRKGDPANWRADISQLNSLLPSWKAKSLRDSLKICVTEWQQEASVIQHA